MNKNTLIRNLCSVEFRSKSKTKRLIEEYTATVQIEILEGLPKIESISPSCAMHANNQLQIWKDEQLKHLTK